MKSPAQIVHDSLTDALSKGPPPPGNLAVPVFVRGTLVFEVFFCAICGLNSSSVPFLSSCFP